MADPLPDRRARPVLYLGALTIWTVRNPMWQQFII